jgi:MFS superfamily sulfate permease-like transporter
MQPTETETGPQRESEQYVFVRRDGTLFFAVAYSWENQTLRYITQEGQRRSVTREALDLAATQQFNEQRGLNFLSPA